MSVPVDSCDAGDLACVIRMMSFDDLRPCVPSADSEWLTPRECAELDRLRHPRRREAWRFGRLLAKHLLLDAAPEAPGGPEDIEILSRDRGGRAVRPAVRIRGRRLPWCLSIAHSDEAALAGVSLDARTMLGVDLVHPPVLRPGFLETWFTERERDWLRAASAEAVAAVWGLKEAIYKACHQGEAFVPRRIEIYAGGAARDWWPGRESAEAPGGRHPGPPLGALTCTCCGIDLSKQIRITIERLTGHLAIVVRLQAGQGTLRSKDPQ